MKQLVLIFIILFSSQLYAETQADTQMTVLGELLYWKTSEVSDENWSQTITPTGAQQSATLHGASFTWKPGFRVGLAYNNTPNTWDTLLSYTNYQASAQNHATGDIYSAYLGNYFANNTNGADFGPTYNSAKIHWNISFQTVDLTLGHQFIVDDHFTLHPVVGLKAGFIDQTIDTTWYGPHGISTFSTATEKLENNYWGIGPSLGLDTDWLLYNTPEQTFSFVANLSGAIMWGNWSFFDQYKNNTPVTINVHSSDVVGASTMARGVLGMDWGKKLTKTQLNIRLAYEAQVWFDQVQYYSLNTGKLDSLMSLQGATLGFYIHY